tara:strand:- start:456 stop:911 length:456 start_codon:yes stop_codon:yes gene_type:complete
MTEENKLKLRAVATEDIEILSTLLQDGLVVSSDLHYEKDEALFVMVINRFCWEQANDGEPEKKLNRCLCGLKVAHVKHVSQRGLSAAATQFYNLLSITYDESKENEKAVNSLTFTFSDGYGIKLTVDELALIVQDIAAPHPALAQPQHDKN